MTARLLMDTNPIRIHPSDTIGVAARKIMRRRYRSLPVVDDDRIFLGVVKVNRMLGIILPDNATQESIGVMSEVYSSLTLDDLRDRLDSIMDDPITNYIDKDVVTVAPETSLIETLLTMYHQERNLPVVNRETGRLEGMISYYDIGDLVLQGGYSQPVRNQSGSL
ncbi:MAG: CBS domain-containing protein [Candidatus Thiodiazotropha sp. (ex Monitilora ramsayi)]|nr:CBS domain-containing protein [Candidatus Thiodiazotropha sp. (ex Monitilora ramsayi)]